MTYRQTQRCLCMMFFAVLAMYPRAVMSQCDGLCGDVSSNGIYTSSDFVPLLHFVQRGEWTSGDSACANVDGDPGLTMRDMVTLIEELVYNDFPPYNFDCDPDSTPYVPSTNSGYRLRHNVVADRGVGLWRMMLHLELTMPNPTAAIALPLRILVDGIPATFGEVDTSQAAESTFDVTSLADSRSASIPPGHLLGSYVDFFSGSGTGTLLLGSVELINLPPGGNHIISVEPVELPSGHNTPMAVESFTRNGWELTLDPCIVCMTGDANNDWEITAADVIVLVHAAFKCGFCYPYPTHATGDVNCSGTFTSSDIIHVVNYLFKGGEPPCDVESECTVTATSWSCP